MMDTFTIDGVNYRPQDREYRVQDGEYVRPPDGRLFLVRISEANLLDTVTAKDLPKGAVIVDLVEKPS